MHTHSLAEYMKCIRRDDWHGVGDLMLSSANKLARAGADFLICPDNTIHQALPSIASRSPLSWLHIAEVVAAQAADRGFRRGRALGQPGRSFRGRALLFADGRRLGALGPDRRLHALPQFLRQHRRNRREQPGPGRGWNALGQFPAPVVACHPGQPPQRCADRPGCTARYSGAHLADIGTQGASPAPM